MGGGCIEWGVGRGVFWLYKVVAGLGLLNLGMGGMGWDGMVGFALSL